MELEYTHLNLFLEAGSASMILLPSGLLELTILAEVVAPLHHLGPSEVYEVVVR